MSSQKSISFLFSIILMTATSIIWAQDYGDSGSDSSFDIPLYDGSSDTSTDSSSDDSYDAYSTDYSNELPTYQSTTGESSITREIHSGISKNPYDYSIQSVDYTGRPVENYTGTTGFQNDRMFSGQEQSPTSGERLYYNQAGQTVGRAETDGNIRRFYNHSGSYTGYSEIDGNRTQYYDARGATNGYSVQEGNITRHYSQHGDYVGYSIDQGNIILQNDNKTGTKTRSINLDQ